MKKSTTVVVTVVGAVSLVLSAAGCNRQPDKDEKEKQTQQQIYTSPSANPGIWAGGAAGRSGYQVGDSSRSVAGSGSSTGGDTSASSGSVSRGGLGGGHVSSSS